MNERIRLLAEQANANELSYAYYRGEKRPENAVTLHSVDLEKFAELIVQECVDRVTSKANEWGDMTGFAIKESILGCAKDLKQHFGVEE